MLRVCITVVTLQGDAAAKSGKRTLTKMRGGPNKRAQLGIRPNEGEHAF